MSQEVLDTGPEQATVSVVSYPEPNSLDDAAVPNSIQAQAYVDNLTAALNSINMAPSSAGISAALLQGQPGMTLPAGVSALQAAKAVEDFVANNPSAAMAPGSVTGATLMPAAAPAGPFTPSAAAGAAMQSAQAMNASIPGMLAAAAGTPMVSGCMSTMPGAGVTVPSAAAAAGMPNLLSAAALQNAQAAAAAAGGPQAVAPPSAAAAAAGLSVTPETPTAAVAGQAGLTAAAPAPPTTSNIAALNANAAAAAAGGMPLLTAPQMVPSSVMPNSSAALLASAGLQQATAFVPTGASAAQIAAGMPELQAVQVVIPAAAAAPNSAGSTTSTLSAAATSALQNAVANQQAAAAAAQNAAAVQNALTNQRIALAGLLSNASNSSAMSGLTDNTMTNNNNNNNNNNMSGFGGLTGSSMTPGLLTGNAFVGSPTAAAAAAGAGGVGGGVPMSMGYGTAPLVGSDSSLHQLKSMSVASSVLSAQPLLDPSSSSASTVAAQVAAMNAAAAAAAGIPASNSGKKVRVLLSSGGVYEELNTSQSGAGSSTTTAAAAATGGRSNRWRYVGGETRLVGLFRTNSFSQFLQQLSKATAAVWDENCRLMYDLPGADGDGGTLIDLFDDDDLEMMWEETDSCMAVRPGFRLHIYAQLGSKRGSAEGSTGTIPSADSNLVKDSGSAGHHRISGSTDPAAAAAPGSSSGAAGAGGGDHSSGAQHSSVYTSSEFEDLVEDLVTVSPKVSLADLEARLEIIKPEDLQPIRLLGTGGFGEVYLCHWHSCEVAVKCLNPNLLLPDGGMGSISKDNVSELLKEAALLGSVRHPNIVWVYGLVLPPLDATLEAVRNHLGPGQEIDAVKMTTQMANRLRSDLMPMSQIRPPALVTEYLASGSLRAAITRRADFLSRDSVRIKLALDTARGMDYLHSKSIVHFDLKTANLLVGMRDKTPICKVADFGLSKQKQQTFVTGVATLRGTLPWIAPEIIKTPGTCTEAVDVYSFGVVLWELWTLREPFEGINYHALLHMMSSSTEAVKPAMPGSSEFEGDIPPEPSPGWAELVSDCLATNADDRPSFRDVVGRLEGMLRANRMSKRRASSSPAAGTGTAGLAATGVSN